MNKRDTGALRFGIAAALICLALGLIGLDAYGLTWDDPENLLTGAHYARFFTTWDWDWLDFARYDQLYAADPSPPPFYNPHFRSAERYPPVANVVSVLTHRLLAGQLGWLGDTDGYHFGVLLFASLTVFVLASFTWQAFGPLAAGSATMALVLYPLFVEHAHLNLKDVPFAALVLLAVWTYWRAVEERRWRWFGLSVCAAGLALGTRVVAAEIWLVVGLAYLPAGWDWLRHRMRERRWHAPPFALRWLWLYVLLSLLVLLAVWPWLWPDPVGRLQAHLAFSRDVGRGIRVLYAGEFWQVGETLPWHYTSVIFLLTTPLPTLLLGLLGVAYALKRGLLDRDAAALMLLALFAFALLRSSWPTLPQYDGTRHMLDGIVAFAGLCGLGADALRRWLGRRLRLSSRLLAVVLVLVYLPLAIRLVRLHPYEGVYYNLLAGGVQGAAGRYPQEYWGSSFRAGCAWLNEHLPGEAVVLPRVGGHLVRYCARPDLRLIPDEALPFLSPTQTVYVIYMTRVDKYDWVATFVDSHLAPVYQLTVEGVPLLKIVRTDAATLVQGREPVSAARGGPTVQQMKNRIKLSM
jgi:4-amino-4-deoxy-L-arabinose transferase-like glycosyltransferase